MVPFDEASARVFAQEGTFSHSVARPAVHQLRMHSRLHLIRAVRLAPLALLANVRINCFYHIEKGQDIRLRPNNCRVDSLIDHQRVSKLTTILYNSAFSFRNSRFTDLWAAELGSSSSSEMESRDSQLDVAKTHIRLCDFCRRPRTL